MKDNNAKLKTVTRKIRMIYYNDYLFENGIITKSEHSRMNNAIISKYGKENHYQFNKKQIGILTTNTGEGNLPLPEIVK